MVSETVGHPIQTVGDGERGDWDESKSGLRPGTKPPQRVSAETLDATTALPQGSGLQSF